MKRYEFSINPRNNKIKSEEWQNGDWIKADEALNRITELEERRDRHEAHLHQQVAELREINFNWQVRDEQREAENRCLRALVERACNFECGAQVDEFIEDCKEEVEKWEKLR